MTSTITAAEPTTPESAVPAQGFGHWDEPVGLSPRGTLIVLAGPGESSAVYTRFASRLASDAYRVRVIADSATDPAASRGAVAALLADESLPAPRVLVGSDSGALLALDLAVTSLVDAVILAGLPTAANRSHPEGSDLSQRTACPNHQGVLSRNADTTAISTAIPAELAGIVASAVTVPVLALHGAADTISPLPAALEAYRSAPRHEIVAIAGGLHDILNDVTHRSVAATIVLFLERLRLDAALTPIVVRDPSSTATAA